MKMETKTIVKFGADGNLIKDFSKSPRFQNVGNIKKE
jgi:hypothetical protein